MESNRLFCYDLGSVFVEKTIIVLIIGKDIYAHESHISFIGKA